MAFPGFFASGFGHARVSRRRKLLALLIALCADLLQIGLFPLVVEGGLSPVTWVVDLAAAFGLVLVVGFKARVVAAFVAELVPGLDLFPTWTALVLTLPVERAAEPVLHEVAGELESRTVRNGER